jgi:hypothetical protein
MKWRASLVFVTLFGSLSLMATRSYAWGPTGHMTVALIAYRKLDADSRTKVDDIMKKHPAYNTFLGKKPNNYPDDGAWVFMMASTWPDMIKDKSNPNHDEFDPDDPALPHGLLHRGIHDVEHFVDIPFNVDVNGPDPRKDAQARTILTALPKWVANLGDATKSDRDRAVALSWVLHLIGDLQQPLHCAQRFTNDLPHGDRGGNEFYVLPGSKPMPLHTYWDDLPGKSKSPTFITHQVDSLLAQQKLQPDKLTELQVKTFEKWAEESFAAAETVAYQGGDVPGVQKTGGQPPVASDVEPLTDKYKSTASDLADRRVVVGGYRLAAVINDAL